MPIDVGGQVVWVDCADEDQATKDEIPKFEKTEPNSSNEVYN